MSEHQTTQRQDCQAIRPLLDDLVDGRLSAREQRRVRRHLASCEPCSEQLAGLEALLAEVDSLPLAIEPPTDLWGGIESRLSPKTGQGHTLHWRRWASRLAAAAALMTLGALLSQVLLPGTRRSHDQPPVATAATGERRADFALAEADYLRAKEVLWAVADTKPEVVSPEVREVVERNLKIIDQAIRELRSALQADPGNPQLENLLLTQHRTEIDLLQRLTLGTSEI